MNPESDYILFVKALLTKGFDTFNLENFSEYQKKDIEKAAETFIERSLFIDAIHTYYMLRNTNKLNEVGEFCLKNKQNEYAYEAFKLADNKEGLTRTGDAFLANAEIEKAHSAFKLAQNDIMIAFIEANFNQGFK